MGMDSTIHDLNRRGGDGRRPQSAEVTYTLGWDAPQNTEVTYTLGWNARSFYINMLFIKHSCSSFVLVNIYILIISLSGKC